MKTIEELRKASRDELYTFALEMYVTNLTQASVAPTPQIGGAIREQEVREQAEKQILREIGSDFLDLDIEGLTLQQARERVQEGLREIVNYSDRASLFLEALAAELGIDTEDLDGDRILADVTEMNSKLRQLQQTVNKLMKQAEKPVDPPSEKKVVKKGPHGE